MLADRGIDRRAARALGSYAARPGRPLRRAGATLRWSGVFDGPANGHTTQAPAESEGRGPGKRPGHQARKRLVSVVEICDVAVNEEVTDHRTVEMSGYDKILSAQGDVYVDFAVNDLAGTRQLERLVIAT